MPKDEKNNADNIPNSVDALAGDIAGDIETAELTDDAIKQVEENAANLNSGPARIEDKDGNLFNPDLHASDKDGNPTYTQTGRFRKKPGRKINATVKTSTAPQAQPGTFEAACAATGIFIQTNVALFGDEWQPEELPHANEEQVLTGAFHRYFEAKNIADIPPGVALSIALLSYSARRMAKPKTKSRLEKMKDWGIAKIANWKVKKNGALFNNRKNGKRENDAGNQDGKRPESQGNSNTHSRS